METADRDRLRASTGAAYLMLRSLRNCARDALQAVAELQDDLDAFASELGLELPGQLTAAQPKEAQPDEYERTDPGYVHNVLGMV